MARRPVHWTPVPVSMMTRKPDRSRSSCVAMRRDEADRRSVADDGGKQARRMEKCCSLRSDFAAAFLRVSSDRPIYTSWTLTVSSARATTSQAIFGSPFLFLFLIRLREMHAGFLNPYLILPPYNHTRHRPHRPLECSQRPVFTATQQRWLLFVPNPDSYDGACWPPPRCSF